LILPDSECLSDSQLTAIRDFVSRGGLVALGQAGLYDEWLRPRATPGLGDLPPSQKPGHSFGEETHWHELTGPTMKHEFERGRAAYVPGVEFDGAMPAARPYFAITNPFWKNPKNAGQIISAARDPLPVRVTAPDYLVANFVRQPETRRWLIHLLNYDAVRTPSISGVTVTLTPTGPGKPTGVKLVSPDSPENQTLSTEIDSSGIHVRIPEVKTYTVVVVDWSGSH